MNNIFVSWKQKIESRIISDLKSQYTGIKGWIFKCEEKADITNEEELLRKLSGNLR